MARSPSREPPTDRKNGGTAAAGVFRHRLGAATAARSRLLGRVIGTPVRSLSPGGPQGSPYPGVDDAVPPEILLQPSPEQRALVDARRADPAGSLRVLAFAGSGKTTALRLLAEAHPHPPLYLADNKAAKLEAQRRSPAHVACRTVHSLAFRATRMFEQ